VVSSDIARKLVFLLFVASLEIQLAMLSVLLSSSWSQIIGRERQIGLLKKVAAQLRKPMNI